MYADMVGEDTSYGWLASERGRLFRDEDFADLYCPDNGRPGVPPSLLATALVLQTHDGDTSVELTEKSEQNTGMEVADTAGECASGDGETRRQFKEAGRKLEAPVPRPPRTGKIPKTEFRIGRKLERVTCPAGKTTFYYTRTTLPPNHAGRVVIRTARPSGRQ